jgi:hypothetical protein
MTCAVALIVAAAFGASAGVGLLDGGGHAPWFLVGIPLLTAHLSRPRWRWPALAVAVAFVIVAANVAAYLGILLVVAAVFAYTAVTHIPARGGQEPPARRPGPVDRPRRAAGTIGYNDVLRTMFTNRANPSPQDDVADLARGVTLHVAARSGRRWGRLVLAPGNLSWQSRRRLVGYGSPVRLEHVAEIRAFGPARGGKVELRTVVVTAGTRRYEYAVTRTDVEVLLAYPAVFPVCGDR